ncbi:MAG: hypothetical protein ACTSR4_00590 [Candidatus Hodarchaeales archaeon]
MSKINLVYTLRGFIVAICSTIIISFMVLILGPILPFIDFDNFTSLVLVCLVFFLTFVTYFMLPTDFQYQEEQKNLSSGKIFGKDYTKKW